MCGIAGFVGGFVPRLAARMNELQAHRGPDGQGTFEDPNAHVALGHVRLAILDLTEAAHQPMRSPDGRYVLVLNGEIYNFRELREELQGRGHRFVSTGDTEVLLHGLMEHGQGFVDRLNGIFAFAFWDGRERELLLARDHLGVKPLYYATPEPGTLLFASEIKALCAHPSLRREPDFEALQQHLAYCHASVDRTAFRGVRRLPPGHCLRWTAKNGVGPLYRYWKPPFQEAADGTRSQAVEELRRVLQEATRRQLVSDVSVGSLFSGGLDSSVITTLAATELGSGLECYTVTYPVTDNAVDRFEEDAPHARRLARLLGLPLREIELRPRVSDLWPRLIWHLDEPIADPAAIASFLMCKAARESDTKVLLSGQGGDELFCGYPRYWVMHATRWARGLPEAMRSEIARAARWLPGAMEGRLGAALRRVRRGLEGLDGSPERQFLRYCANTPQAEIDRVTTEDFRSCLGGTSFMDDCLSQMGREGLVGLQRLQERDLSVYLPNHNLLYTDKTGMAVGVEVRVPLLDVEIVNRVVRYPSCWHVERGRTKVLFRDAARGTVPDEVIRRPKAGLGAPYRKWLRHDLAQMWNDLTSEETVRRRGWFDHRALQDARRRSDQGRDDLYMLQWAVLTIELWARQFMDEDPARPRGGPPPGDALPCPEGVKGSKR